MRLMFSFCLALVLGAAPAAACDMHGMYGARYSMLFMQNDYGASGYGAGNAASEATANESIDTQKPVASGAVTESASADATGSAPAGDTEAR